MPLPNREIHKLVYEIVTEAMIVADQSGTIVNANPAATTLFKYPTDVLVGMNVDQLLPDALQKAHAEHRKDFAEKPSRRSMGMGLELTAKDANGKLIPVEVSLNHANPVEEFRVVALVSDITKRKEAEKKILEINKQLEEGVKQRTKELDEAVKALEASQHLYTLIAQNFPDGTINVLDKNFSYVFAEGKEFVRSAIDRNKVIGLNYISLLPAEYREKVKNELNRVLEGLPRTFEIVTRGNTYIMTAVPLYDENESINRLLLVEKNITEQKRAEQEMIHALKKERELNELKSRFVSMASHEFRTPLATVLSSVNLVSRHAEKGNLESVTKHVDRIKSSIRNLTTILNDFLSLEKLELGKVEYRPVLTNIKELVHSVIEEIEATCKPNQMINLSFDANLEAKIDPQMVRNILYNLLSNAVKYSPEGSEINVDVEEKDDNLVVNVTDKGIGIPEEEHGHLFERFFRAKNATNIQGTGLGLNIVAKHTELMGGTINFESKLNEGTTFTITVPRNTPPTE